MEDTLAARVGEIQNRVGKSKLLIQIYPKDIPFNNEVPYTVMIGYPVENLTAIPDGMMAHIVPAGDYVKVTHVGLESELSQTYDFLYQSWLPESGNMSAAYDFEVWDERYQPEQPNNEIDLYVALAPQPVLT